MARTRANRKKDKPRFSLKSGNNSTFKLMGSARTPYPLKEGAADSAYPMADNAGDEAGSVFIKSDSVLTKGIDPHNYKKGSSWKQTDDDDNDDTSVEVDTPEEVDTPVEVDTPEEVEVDTPETTTDDDDTTDEQELTADGEIEMSPGKETASTNEPNIPVENPDDTTRENMSYDVPEEIIPEPTEFKDDESGVGNIAEDAGFKPGDDLTGTEFMYNSKGEIIRRDSPITEYDDGFYGDDIIPRTRVEDENLEEINQRRLRTNEFTGKALTDPLGTGEFYDTLQDASETVRGRQTTTGVDSEGNEVRITEGKGDDASLLSKEVIKDQRGLLGAEPGSAVRFRPNRKVRKDKEKNTGAVYIDPDTGEMKYKDEAVVTKTGEGFLGLQNRQKYIDGKLVTPEYKQQIRDTKKSQKKKEKEEKKQQRLEKKRVYNETKHVYEGMNAGQAEKAKGVHEAAAREANMSYEDYIKKNFPKKEERSFRDSFRGGNTPKYDDYDYSAENY